MGWAMVFFNEYQQGHAAVLSWRCCGSRASTYRTVTRALGACTLVVVISLSYFSMVSYYSGSAMLLFTTVTVTKNPMYLCMP